MNLNKKFIFETLVSISIQYLPKKRVCSVRSVYYLKLLVQIKLDSIKIDTPIVPIVSNVSAEAISDPDTIKKLLVSQVTGSVRWRESILWMAANDVDEIWEVGSGKALSGMIRRIDKDISLKNFSSAEDIKSAVF